MQFCGSIEVILQTHSQEENKVPEVSLKLERWQGPPHANKDKRDEAVLSFNVRFVYLGFFFFKSVIEDLPLPIKTLSTCTQVFSKTHFFLPPFSKKFPSTNGMKTQQSETCQTKKTSQKK